MTLEDIDNLTAIHNMGEDMKMTVREYRKWEMDQKTPKKGR